MELNDQSIMFFTRTMGLGGPENVVLQLCEVFKEEVKKIVVCSGGGVNVKKLEKMDIRHYRISDIERKNPSVIRQTSAILRKIIKDEKITVIHTHHRMAAFYVALLGLQKKCVFINTSHNTFYDKKILTRFAYRKAHLITCGEMVKRNLVEYFKIPPEQVTVIHNAVKPFADFNEIDCFIEKDSLICNLHEKGYFAVGNIGRLSEQKGMEYYLKAIPMVLENHPNVAFLIVGEGEDEKKLKELAEKLGIRQDVHFMGYRADIQNLMAQMDLIVLSSLWEGLPLTPIEAFSVGKTVVATAVDGTVEIVEDGKDGFLVKARDSVGLAEKIIYIKDNPDLKEIMEENSRKKFINEFSFEQLKEKYIDFYRRVNE